MNDLLEVLVVGGGPAGAMAALQLAKAGRSCTLLERSATPGAKVCGEFLSPEAVESLDELGFPWRAAEAVTLEYVRLQTARRDTTARLPFTPAARSVARPVLDGWLLDEARAHGATVRRGVSVKAVEPRGDMFCVRTSDGTLQARNLILATGKHTIHQFHPRQAGGGPRDLVGYKMNFRDLSSSLRLALGRTLALFFFPGGYGGIARVSHDEATVSLLASSHWLRSHGNRDLALLTTLAKQAPLLDQLLREAVPAWPRPLTVANLPYGHCDPNQAAHAGLFAVGDQFAVLPSFTGTGLAFAITSGRLAAANLVTWPRGEAASRHARQAADTARAVMKRAMWLHRWLQRPAFARTALSAIAVMPRLTSAVALATRLPLSARLAGTTPSTRAQELAE